MLATRISKQKYDQQMSETQEFLIQKKIPYATREKVRRYMEHMYAERSVFDEERILSRFPPAILKDLLNRMYRRRVVSVPLFHDLDEEIITKICLSLKPYTALQSEIIVAQDSPGTEMYIL